MATPLYTVGTVLTADQQRAGNAWLSLANWKPNQITVGAVKVGSRWQPITARCIALRSGHLSHFDHVVVAEQRGYPTIKAACQAGRKILTGK